jgi:hypothetical protein
MSNTNSNNDIYYYKCGTHYDTEEIHCTKSYTSFKNFDNPKNYGNIKHIILSKTAADRCTSLNIVLSKTAADRCTSLNGIPPIGTYALAVYVMNIVNGSNPASTGEEMILKYELNTSSYYIINKN